MYVHWLHQMSDDHEDLLGGKGANLGRLTQLGAPVPPGFCVNLWGYQHFIATTNVGEAVERFLSDINGSDLQELHLKCAGLQKLFLATEIPPAVAQEVSNAYQELRSTGSSEPLVAVRSSATAEDMPNASFAGQYDSYLGIRGEDGLREHLVRCWASLWNPQAVQYRQVNGIDHRQVAMPVVVQHMVPATCAGVLFTANPVSGDHSEIVINSSWGLGESVVIGSVVPDTYVIDKASKAVKARSISRKETLIELGEEFGTKESPVPARQQEQPSLSNEQLAELYSLAMTIEDYYRSPQDIEWGYDGERFAILQSRPITGLPDFPFLWEDEDDVNHPWTLATETGVSPLLPLDESVRRVWFMARHAGFEERGDATIPAVRVINGYVYSRPVPSPASEDETLQKQRAFQSKLESYWEQGTTLWETEHYPYISATNKRLKAFDLSNATDEALLHHLMDVLQEYERYWVIHWLRGAQLRDHWLETFTELTGIPDQTKAHEVSSGPNKATEVVEGLIGLARAIKASPHLSNLFETFPPTELLVVLEGDQESQGLYRQVSEFLEAYGDRAGFGFGGHSSMAVPTWRDDPSLVLTLIGRYLPMDLDAQAAKEEQALREREALVKEAYEAVGPDEEKRRKFEKELILGRKATAEQEDHNFHLDQIIGALVRFTLLQMGRRFQDANVIPSRDDIFYLSLHEVEVGLQDLGKAQHHDTVRARKLQHEERLKMTPPRMLGESDRGGAASQPASATASTANGGEPTTSLKGVAASAGLATGIARVVSTSELVPDIKPGEILVAHNAGPLWTPIFPVMGALVLNAGAILLHAATVAREYKIPAVIQTQTATEVIQDGQVITVDGTNGIVLLNVP